MLFLAIPGSIMVSGQVLWVPTFLIINQVGLVDNLFGVTFWISPKCSASS